MFNVHPTISTTDISRNTLSVSDIKLEDDMLSRRKYFMKDTISLRKQIKINMLYILIFNNILK